MWLGLRLSHQLFRFWLRRRRWRFGIRLRLLSLLYSRLNRRVGAHKRLNRRFRRSFQRSLLRECSPGFVMAEHDGKRHSSNRERQRAAHHYETYLQEKAVFGPPVALGEPHAKKKRALLSAQKYH
jgi:hypothetical protein